MKYLVDIPEEIEQALEMRASAMGDNVVHQIETAVVSFVRGDATAILGGRRPDPALDGVETLVSCGLPRTNARSISVQIRAHRRPDPIAGSV